MVDLDITLEQVLVARDKLRDHLRHTPCREARALSKLCGSSIYCKQDYLQVTGSFKERGACYKLLLLSESERRVGVVAASAGNHALGLSYHGGRLGVPVTVVMPRFAPIVKVEKCKELGATVVLHGDNFDESKQHALELSSARGLCFVHGFDDADIVRGQATLALEVLEDVPDLDVLLVPMGGGGLAAGVALVAKSIKPDLEVIGVEPENAPTLHAALKHGSPVSVKLRPTLADGLAVVQAGQLTFELIRQHIDDTLVVNEAEIAGAILRLIELERVVVEGSAAVTLAAALRRLPRLQGKRCVLLLTGANIDITLLSRVIERGLVAEGRLCKFQVELVDHPGSLARLLELFAEQGASIMQVDHDRNFGPADVSKVTVSCVLETRSSEHIAEIVSALQAANFEFRW